MNKPQPNLQDGFLNHVRKGGVQVTVELMSGVTVTGTVKGFDSFTVILESGKCEHLVYKHAITMISPVGVEVSLSMSERRQAQPLSVSEPVG